jgi:hypothetical protein
MLRHFFTSSPAARQLQRVDLTASSARRRSANSDDDHVFGEQMTAVASV